MKLESLKASKFEALTSQQLKSVTGGDEVNGDSKSPNGEPMLFKYKGENYFVLADKWTRDVETGAYTCLELQGRDGKWETIV